MPAIVNSRQTVYVQNKITLRFTITDGDATGTPALDLTPFEATGKVTWSMVRGTISKSPTAAALEKCSDVSGEVSFVDAANGVVDVLILTEDTATFAPGVYYYELEIVDASGERVVVAVGELEFRRNLATVC